MRRGGLVAALLGLGVSSCSCDTLPRGAVTSCQTVQLVAKPEATDILFVVDDSGSMRPEQDNLAQNFDAFIAKLDASPVKNAYQIGVTNTSVDMVAADSAGNPVVLTDYAQGTPNAGHPYPAGALVAVDPASINPDPTLAKYVYDASGKYAGKRILTAGSPTLVADFSANVHVGTYGSGKEQGLRAALLALKDRVADGTNAGFLRKGAKLAVIIVSDDDDCADPSHKIVFSATSGDACHTAQAYADMQPVQDFVSFLQGSVDGEQRDAVVAAIVAYDTSTQQPAVDCTLGNAQNPSPEAPGTRYAAFVKAFGSSGLVDDICNTSFRATLEKIAGLIEPGQTVPIDPPPADWRLLVVNVVKASGQRVGCSVAGPGVDAGAPAADGGPGTAVYAPPSGAKPATLTFGGACTLQQGDQIDLKMICAG